jgi:hypothetical protein
MMIHVIVMIHMVIVMVTGHDHDVMMVVIVVLDDDRLSIRADAQRQTQEQRGSKAINKMLHKTLPTW